MLCSLLNEFRREHRADKITLITWSQKHADIISLYDINVEIKVCVRPFPIIDKFLEFKKGSLINLHHFYYMKGIRRLMGYEGVTLFDIFKLLLDVPLTSQPEAPVFARTEDKITFVETLFKNANLRKGRTILLAPEATTIEEININFWKELIERLQKLDYDLALSAYKKEYTHTLSIPVVNFSFKYAIAAVDYAGYFVSMRSGFCDIVSASVSPKIILYPKMHWFGGELIKAATLKQLSPENNDVLFELEYSNEETQAVVNRIVEIIQLQEKVRRLDAVYG